MRRRLCVFEEVREIVEFVKIEQGNSECMFMCRGQGFIDSIQYPVLLCRYFVPLIGMSLQQESCVCY